MDYYIIPVDFIECEDTNLSYPIKIDDLDFMYFFKKDILGSPILNDKFQYIFGYSYLERIREGNYLIIKEFVKGDSEKIKHQDGMLNFQNEKTRKLHVFYEAAHLYLFALWMIKDNSVNTPFGIYINPEFGIGSPAMKKVMFTNSSGKYGDTLFKKDEIKSAHSSFELLCGLFVKHGENNREYSTYNSFGPEIDPNMSSFKRAVNYVEAARSTSFLPAKIAFYISTLETLFVVTDSNSYKTPERTTVFLGGNMEERHAHFRIVRESYDVRSSYVHGSDVYKKHKKRLDEISNDLDTVVRKVLTKFFTECQDLNYSGDDYKRINQHFIDLILGGELNE
ncbi:hypothetical protein [Bacillus wiedmannii]|uniref:hypothetical protein n=1 Tax=Bacillus wiedmannii TaxID=1890302 RepID=UPI002FFF57E7